MFIKTVYMVLQVYSALTAALANTAKNIDEELMYFN